MMFYYDRGEEVVDKKRKMSMDKTRTLKSCYTPRDRKG